ncbi:MAG: UbiD family decarboxylase [Steroidobacteraceae bacterium]
MTDLRSFLHEHAAAVWSLPKPVSVRHSLTALQHRLDRSGHFPVLLARKVVLPDGQLSDIPVVTNLTASRELTAQALGVTNHRDMAAWFAARSASAIAPQVLSRDRAPVQSRVFQGDEADLTRLPALIQHCGEPGPYLTAAHATTYDPDTGVDNTAIQRCWIKGPRIMSWWPYPATHNARNLRKFTARGEACPVVFWIGHHPRVLIGTQAKLSYPQSHWQAAGGVLGSALRVVPSISHGERIMVPADAEIVIEGRTLPGQLAPDGPFGEYTGYMGPAVDAPLVEVSCITMRDEAIYHDYGSGLTDMLVPDNMAMEGKLFGMIKAVAPSLRNVYVPASTRRFVAIVQLAEPLAGEARDALVAALAYRRVKAVIVVDADVDIFDKHAVDWAVATRTQWRRDTVVVDGLSGSSLDPSLPEGEGTTSKIGIDATRSGRNKGKPVPVLAVPDTADLEAADLLAGANVQNWPIA